MYRQKEKLSTEMFRLNCCRTAFSLCLLLLEPNDVFDIGAQNQFTAAKRTRNRFRRGDEGKHICPAGKIPPRLLRLRLKFGP